MKSILLAAAAFIAVPAIAQDQMAAPAGQTAPATTPDAADPAADPAMQSAPADPAAQPAPADPAMQAPPAPTGDTGAPISAPAPTGDPAMADPAGGYQPSSPPIQGTATPGATVRFQAAADPNTAYPPPPPMAKYPICKKGQYDNCMQRGGK